MTITIGEGLQNLPYPKGYTGPARASDRAAQFQTKFDTALSEFEKLAFQTPAERAREAVLKRHGLDEKALAGLDAAPRNTIEQEIADSVRRATGAESPKSRTS